MVIQEKISAQIFFRNGASITLTEKNIISASVRRQCCPDSNFEIGGVYSASLSMTASVTGTNSYNIRGAKIILENQYGNETALQQMGVFWVTQAQRISGDLYSLTAQDAVGWLDTSSENYSENISNVLENLTQYLGMTYNNSPTTIQGWCERIVTETCNSLLSRIFGENLLKWENYNLETNGRYTNEWNFEPIGEGVRELLFTCSVQNASGQSDSPRDLLHYLAELAGGFIYARENGSLTLGQFGPKEFGQAEVYPHEIESDSLEIAEYLLQRILVYLQAYHLTSNAFTSIESWAEYVPFRIKIDSNPFLDGFSETNYFRDYVNRYGDGFRAIKDGLFYFHHRKNANGELEKKEPFCYFRPFHCKVHKQERFFLGQRIHFILGQSPAEQAFSTITSVKWTFRGGWELACAGEDSRSMADALRRSKADKALTDAKLRYESLISKISGV